MPKFVRMPPPRKMPDKNQTYYVESHLGKQTDSKKKSSEVTHFGTSTRSDRMKQGIFKSQMSSGPRSIKINHPKYWILIFCVIYNSLQII